MFNKYLQYIQEGITLNLVDVKRYGFPIDDTQIKKYSKNKKILLNKKVVDALIRAKKDLPKGYNFCIMYGYRSLEEQTEIVKQTEIELKKSHPNNWEKLLDKYTGGYKDLKEKKISFMNHRSGNAVDLKLVNGEKEVNLGGVKLNQKDNLDYYENKRNLSDEDNDIKINRHILKDSLESQGFEFYSKEWWHWGYK